MGVIPKYENDGSGRDTYVNHQGASYLNPMPGGSYYRSRPGKDINGFEDSSKEILGGKRDQKRVLFNQSRYGTTVKQRAEGDHYIDELEKQPLCAGEMSAVRFDPESLALDQLPYHVPRPEDRLKHPGHAQTGTEGTGGVTFTGTKDPWSEPNQLSNTLTRIEPTYESTCHYGLRTGKFYCDDMAPAHSNKLPDKGSNWGKSRYF